MRWLMWLALGLLVYLALRSRAKSRRSQFERDQFGQPGHSSQSMPPVPPTSRPSSPVETMVACSYCQIYLPASEAITRSVAQSVTALPVLYFCCEEHARLHSHSGKTSAQSDE